MRTVIGVLPTVSEANHVAHDLEFAGIARNEINVVPAAADPRELRKVELAKRTNGTAALTGALRGALLGLILGGLMLSMPGVKPFFGGSVVATIAGGCLLVALLMSFMAVVSNMGQLHEEAALFEEAVHEKGVFVAAHVSEHNESIALKILGDSHARDVHSADEVSHLSRWTAMYNNPNPYPCDSQVSAHTI